jgi:general secretion pathway protein K
VALITVLLIVFLASMTAVSLATLQQIAIRRSTVLQHQQQARLFTLGAEQWAMLILARDRKANQIDHPGEAWANPSITLPIAGGALSARIRDLQGCFNLNNLWQAPPTPLPGSAQPPPTPEPPNTQKNAADKQKNKHGSGSSTTTPAPGDPPSDNNDPSASTTAQLDQAQFQVLQRLLISLELKPDLAQAIVDWIDPDQEPLFPEGAEDSEYSIRNPSYLAANRRMYSVSELRLVRGIDQDSYSKLAPLVCTLDRSSRLNVNTASARVLAALSENADVKELERLLENRHEEGYKTVDDFLNAAKLTVDAALKEQLSVDSQHFLLQVEAQVGDGRAMLYSTLYRDENGVRVLQRSFGQQD